MESDTAITWAFGPNCKGGTRAGKGTQEEIFERFPCPQHCRHHVVVEGVPTILCIYCIVSYNFTAVARGVPYLRVETGSKVPFVPGDSPQEEIIALKQQVQTVIQERNRSGMKERQHWMPIAKKLTEEVDQLRKHAALTIATLEKFFKRRGWTTGKKKWEQELLVSAHVALGQEPPTIKGRHE